MAHHPSVSDLQHLEVWADGPEKANRLFVTTGTANTGLYAGAGQTKKENYSILVPPQLASGQFRRAIGSAALADIAGDGLWKIEDVDADFDDETNQVEFRFTLEVANFGSGYARIETVNFTVTSQARL